MDRDQFLRIQGGQVVLLPASRKNRSSWRVPTRRTRGRKERKPWKSKCKLRVPLHITRQPRRRSKRKRKRSGEKWWSKKRILSRLWNFRRPFRKRISWGTIRSKTGLTRLMPCWCERIIPWKRKYAEKQKKGSWKTTNWSRPTSRNRSKRGNQWGVCCKWPNNHMISWIRNTNNKKLSWPTVRWSWILINSIYSRMSLLKPDQRKEA